MRRGGLEVGVRDSFSLSLLSRDPPLPGVRILPVPSRGELWRRRFSLFVSRVRWSLRLLLRGSTATCLVTKASGGWRPIISLSTLNLSVVKTRFQMETAQSVLRSVRWNDWMFSVDLKDAYLQVQIHPLSRKFLRFTARGKACQFKVLCFCLSTALLVFTRVMAFVSGFLHQSGIRMLSYLDDWLILALSHEEACWARDKVLSLCQDLGIINSEKSSLIPTQTIVYPGIKIESDFPGFADSFEDRKVLLSSRRISVFKGAVYEVMDGFAGSPRIS